MRPIDASGFERELIADMSLYGEKISGDEAYNRALLLLAGAPTLTPPNKPLTSDELRQMSGEPVWVEEVEHWALIDIEKNGQWAGIPFAVWAENGANFTYNIEDRELHCFRRPPEYD